MGENVFFTFRIQLSAPGHERAPRGSLGSVAGRHLKKRRFLCGNLARPEKSSRIFSPSLHPTLLSFLFRPDISYNIHALISRGCTRRRGQIYHRPVFFSFFFSGRWRTESFWSNGDRDSRYYDTQTLPCRGLLITPANSEFPAAFRGKVKQQIFR